MRGANWNKQSINKARTSINRNQKIKLREGKRHNKIVCPIQSKNDLLWGREQFPIPLSKKVLNYKRSQLSYRN
jgi:hypothetical protein